MTHEQPYFPEMAYDPETRAACVDEICRDLSEGITLSEICRRDHMPSRVAVYDWADEKTPEGAEIALRIARARELGFDALAEDCIAIAEDGTNDYVERKRENGGTFIELDREHVQRSKLRVDTRLKLLAKWSHKYADRQQIAHTNRDGEDIPVSPVILYPVDVTRNFDEED